MFSISMFLIKKHFKYLRIQVYQNNDAIDLWETSEYKELKFNIW